VAGPRQAITRQVYDLSCLPSAEKGGSKLAGIAKRKSERLPRDSTQQLLPCASAMNEFSVAYGPLTSPGDGLTERARHDSNAQHV
jgi:hypothetical protein